MEEEVDDHSELVDERIFRMFQDERVGLNPGVNASVLSHEAVRSNQVGEQTKVYPVKKCESCEQNQTNGAAGRKQWRVRQARA